MSHFIARLSQIITGKRPTARATAGHADDIPVDLESLAALLPQLRQRLPLASMSDDALLASLVTIARHATDENRWRAAEASTLGQHLAVESDDLQRDLVTVLSLLPIPYL